MTLPEVVSKLKKAKLKDMDLHIHDMDRAGDVLLALTVALTATGVVISQLYGSGPGFANYLGGFMRL